MPTSRLTLEYDGTEFSGWAKQPGLRTVQAEVERALQIALRLEEVPVTVAGRTDAGVHARAQVASYAGDPAGADSLNALLPYDVAVLECVPAPPGFDARRDATSRAYGYRILTRRARSPQERSRALHWPHPVDAGTLHACAELLCGRHDFTAFTPTDTDHVHFERHVMSSGWQTVGPDLVEFQIEADAFMRNMIRVLVGTMLEVAGGRRTVDQLSDLLEGRPRAQAGATAPPHGLHFLGAGYHGRQVLPSMRESMQMWTNV